jgi:hypothetical protein
MRTERFDVEGSLGVTLSGRLDRRIGLGRPLDAGQTAKLFEIADKRPVHRTLARGARLATAARFDHTEAACCEGEA